MATLWQDLRYTIRMLGKNPRFAVAAVLSLALGIGVNATMFGIVNAVLLRSLPFQQPERIVDVAETFLEQGIPWFAMAPANFLDFREQNQVFEDMAAIESVTLTLTGVEEPTRLSGQRVSASYFPILGIKPALGRGFLPEEDQPAAAPVVVLSHSLWQNRFGSDPGILGQSLPLDGRSHTVVGVMPARFRFFWNNSTEDTQIWLPYPFASDPPTEREVHRLYAIARLKPGVSLEHARAEMGAIAHRLAQSYPKEDAGLGVAVNPLLESVVGSFRPSLLMLLGAVR